MKLLHTSDWHIGRSLFEFSLLEDQRYIFQQFYQIVEEERPDAILVSGDLYDRSLPSAQAVSLLDEIFTTLITRFHIPILGISGNHDSARRIAYGSRLFEESGLYLEGNFSPKLRKITLQDQFGPVNFFLLPYFFPQQVRLAMDLSPEECRTSSQAFQKIMEYNAPFIPKEERCVLLAHGFFMKSKHHDPQEAPEMPATCQSETMVGTSDLTDLSVADCFDYVALGHLHNAQSAGCDTMRYSGSPLKYSLDEANSQKSVTVVEMGEKGQVSYRKIPLSPLRDLRLIQGSIEELCDPELASDDYVFAQIISHGPVLNAMGRLREVYPHTLGLSFQQFAPSQSALPERDMASLPPEDLFCRFYQHTMNQELTEADRELIQEVFRSLDGDDIIPEKEN